MDAIVTGRRLPQLEGLLHQLLREKRAPQLTVDGSLPRELTRTRGLH